MPISIERERIAPCHALQHAPRAGVGPPHAFPHPSAPGAWQYKRRGIIGANSPRNPLDMRRAGGHNCARSKRPTMQDESKKPETPQQHLERMRRWRQEEKSAREAGKLLPPDQWPETIHIPRSSIRASAQQAEPNQHKHPAKDFLRATRAERAARAETVRAMIYTPPPDTGKAGPEAQDNEQERKPPPYEHPAAAFYRETRAERARLSGTAPEMIFMPGLSPESYEREKRKSPPPQD